MPQNMRKTPYGYQYRKVIPAELRTQLGKREIKVSLGKDFRAAKARLAELEVETNQIFSSARAAADQKGALQTYEKLHPKSRPIKKLQASNPNLAGQLSALWLSSLVRDLKNRQSKQLEYSVEELNENVGEILPHINNALASGEVTAFYPTIDFLVAGRGYQLVATDEEMQHLTYETLKHIRTSYKILAARQQGDITEPDMSELPQPLPGAWEPAPAKIKAPEPRLSDVTIFYSKYLEPSHHKTRTTNLSIWQRLVEFCNDKPLKETSSDDIYRFIESRLTSQSKPWGTEYAQKAKKRLETVFELAKTKGLTGKNPASEMTIFPKISKQIDAQRKKPRHPFKTEHLNEIFKSEWYTPDTKRWRGKMAKDLGARYWIPLICLYHGLRIREAIQIHTHDIITEDPPRIKIQTELKEDVDNTPERTLKNEATKRTVPIHPKLLELGFIDFVKEAKGWTLSGPIFPSALPDENSKNPIWGRAYEQRFVPFVRDTLGFGRGYCNHSFRHSIEDCILDLQLDEVWPPGLQQFYTGRTLPRDADKFLIRQRGSEKDYGDGYTPERILPYVRRIQYPGIVLPPTFKVWLKGLPSVHSSLLTEFKKKYRKTDSATTAAPSK